MTSPQPPNGPNEPPKQPAPTSVTEQVAGRLDWLDAVSASYKERGLAWGTGDVLALGAGDPITRVGALVAMLRAFSREGHPTFREIVVIAPPSAAGLTGEWRDEAAVRSALQSAFADGWTALGGVPLNQAALEGALRVVRVIIPASLALDALLASIGEALTSVADESAILIADASLYRADDIRPVVGEVSHPADLWAPHVHVLLRRVIDTVAVRSLYVVVDLGAEYPSTGAAHELLVSVERWGVLAMEAPATIVGRAELARWDQMVEEGNLGAALAEIDALDKIPPWARALFRSRLWTRAGFSEQARTILRTAPLAGAQLSPDHALRIAQAAEKVDADDIALEMLTRAIPELRERDQLELALILARRMGKPALVDQIVDRIRRLHPGSATLAQYDVEALVSQGRYQEAARLLRGVHDDEAIEEARLWEIVADCLLDGGDVDVAALATAVDENAEWTARARRLVADVLERNGLRREAIAFLLHRHNGSAVGNDARFREGSPDEESSLDVLRLVERARLAGNASVDVALVTEAIEWVIRGFGRRPRDTRARARLERILGPQLLGVEGVAALAECIVRLASEPRRVEAAPPRRTRTEGLTLDDIRGLVRRGFAWMDRERIAVMGRHTIPRDLLDLPADDATALLEELLALQVERLSSDADVDSFRTYLTLALAVAPLGSLPDHDLAILRVAAGRLANVGRGQFARDLAEQTLMLAGPTPRRRRLAWAAYADIHARAGTQTEAMTAAVCALSIDAELSWDQLHHESSLLLRLLRDAGLHMLARPLVARIRTAANQLDPDGRFTARLDSIDLQLTVDELSRTGPLDPVTLPQLLDKATTIMRGVLDSRDEIAPATAVLSYLVLEAERQSIAVSPEASAALDEAVKRLGPGMAARMTLARDKAPSLKRLVELIARIEDARYRQDVAYDRHLVALVAERLLASDAARDPEVAAYAIEALADAAIVLPGRDAGAHAVAAIERDLLSTPDGPLSAAVALARDGLSVVALGVAANGLTRLEVTNGRAYAPVVEPATVFAITRLHEWTRRYPYDYHDTQDPNAFFTTTAGIGVNDLPERAVVVGSTTLQAFPPNLLNVADPHFGAALAGTTRRLAAAPSVAWLHAARRSPFVGNKRRSAWISTAEPEEGYSTLAILADRLANCLRDHAVTVETGDRIPAGLAGSELAIVAAHGGVADRNRYFQGVRDEATLVMGSGALADALAGVQVVVLFVCSGGRVDRHPEVSAMVGLVKQLLDRGCRAVVAPPWPLEILVPPAWLPTFLAEWARGAQVIDASFVANQAVRRVLGDTPRQTLAMTVYGDPIAAALP